MDKQALLDLIPAYAIDALDPDERALVEAQLQTDPEARRLLDDYRTVGDALVLAVPAIPAPAHLGDNLRRRMAASRARPALRPSAMDRPSRAATNRGGGPLVPATIRYRVERT